MSVQSANLSIMLRAAEKASKSLLRDFGEVEQLQVSKKGPANFVSAADRRAEEIIHEELKKARPSFGFLMEETGEHKGEDGEYRFIVDPLDGTTNFLHGIPHWCISIGLEKGNDIISALVHDPVKNETFTAEKGTGAFMQNRRLRVSARTDLGLSVIAGGDAASRPASVQKDFLKCLAALTGRTSGFRRSGSAALDLAYVAAGRYDGFWEMGLQPWDCAAGVLIVKEAGGAVFSLKGNANPVYAEVLMASNMGLHQQLKDLFKTNLD
jgi:myo-inositol-1(or 4)-monophosphatase